MLNVSVVNSFKHSTVIIMKVHKQPILKFGKQPNNPGYWVIWLFAIVIKYSSEHVHAQYENIQQLIQILLVNHNSPVCISTGIMCYVCMLHTVIESTRAGMVHSNKGKWQQQHTTLRTVMIMEKMR